MCKYDQWDTEILYSPAFPETLIGQKTGLQAVGKFISLVTRVSPFRLKIFFAYKRNKANLDPFHLCFTISLQNFTSLFSLLFASFRFKFFASLHFGSFCFEVKQSEAKFKSIFSLFFTFFRFFSLFSLFFRFFRIVFRIFSLFSLQIFRFASI